MHSVLHDKYQTETYLSPWLTYVKSILNDRLDITIIPIFNVARKDSAGRLIEQSWQSSMKNMRKYNLYILFKCEFKLETYLLNLPEISEVTLCRFRTTNNKLPIKTGRHEGKDRSLGLRKLSMEGNGLELHFLLVCKCVDHIRKQNIPAYFCNNPNELKFAELMSEPKYTLSVADIILNALPWIRRNVIYLDEIVSLY